MLLRSTYREDEYPIVRGVDCSSPLRLPGASPPERHRLAVCLATRERSEDPEDPEARRPESIKLCLYKSPSLVRLVDTSPLKPRGPLPPPLVISTAYVRTACCEEGGARW